MNSADLKKRPKVGIFMPCYNLGDYINEALDSLYKQTYQDFTVIVADDASTHKSTLRTLSSIDLPRCEIYYEKKNLGLIKISNKYMEKLNADYIMLFNADDKLHPNFLADQVDYLDTHPDIHAVSTWVQEFGEGNRLIKYTEDACKLPYMLIENNFSGAALMRKTAWLAAGKHDTNKDLYPNLDYDLWLSMLNKGFTLGIVPKPLFYWRVRGSSLSHSVDPKKMYIFRKALMKKYSSLYQEHSRYVMQQYLELLYKFEKHYVLSEEGHTWLDQQYKNLTKENILLRSSLENSIQRPYLKSIYHKIKNRVKRKS